MNPTQFKEERVKTFLHPLIILSFESSLASLLGLISETIISLINLIPISSSNSFHGWIFLNTKEFLRKPVRRAFEFIRIIGWSSRGPFLCIPLIEKFLLEELSSYNDEFPIAFGSDASFLESMTGLLHWNTINVKARDLKRLKDVIALIYLRLMQTCLEDVPRQVVREFQEKVIRLKESVPSMPDHCNICILGDLGKVNTHLEALSRLQTSKKQLFAGKQIRARQPKHL